MRKFLAGVAVGYFLGGLEVMYLSGGFRRAGELTKNVWNDVDTADAPYTFKDIYHYLAYGDRRA